jgi:hypothetical protein
MIGLPFVGAEFNDGSTLVGNTADSVVSFERAARRW